MDNRRDEPNLKLINMEQVEIEKIDWLLYPFIPFGKVTIVQGDPGEGKTTMVLQIIAKMTKQFLFKAMNRRGCRRAYTWNGFVEMLKYYPLAKPKTYYCLY